MHRNLKRESFWWVWLSHILHLLLMGGCYFLSTVHFFLPRFISHPLPQPLLTLLNQYIVLRCGNVTQYYHAMLFLCALISLIAMLTKVVRVYSNTTPSFFSGPPHRASFIKKQRSSTDIIREPTTYYVPRILDLIVSMLAFCVGVTRGVGLCVVSSHILGYRRGAGELCAVVFESLQVPLVLSLQMLPYSRFMRLLLLGVVLAPLSVVIRTMGCLHPNARVEHYIQNLTSSQSPYDLLQRRITLLHRLEKANVEMYCRSDQKLCRLQKTILGMTQDPLQRPYHSNRTSCNHWTQYLWQSKYLISRDQAEKTCGENVHSLNVVEDGVPLHGTESFNLSNEFNAYFLKQPQPFTRHALSKSAKSGETVPIRAYTLTEEHLAYGGMDAARSKVFNGGEGDPLQLKRSLLVECSVRPDSPKRFVALEWEGVREQSFLSTDIVVVCHEALDGKEFYFLMQLTQAGTSPVWRFPNSTNNVTMTYSGVLSLEELEGLIAS